MNTQPKLETDLTIQSFSYVARKLAQATPPLEPSVRYEHILSEAEKHCSALRLMQRDVFEKTEQELREHAMSKTEFQSMRQTVAHSIAQAQQAITHIAAHYAPRKLAA